MIYELNNNHITTKVNSFGAELCSVISKETGIEYIWQAEGHVWARHAPNLFPIVGKLKKETYTYQDKSYQLPQHGFARDNEFICIEETASTLTFKLESNEKLYSIYPFQFCLQIKYTLLNNSITVEYLIINTDKVILYFSIGAHPAFNCPLTVNETFEDYELIFPNKNSLILNGLNDGLISEQTKIITLKNNSIPIMERLFDDDALVFTNHQINEVQLISKRTKRGVILKSLNWPYYGIWTKKNTSKFVCLEPWYGIADFENSIGDFSTKEGIMKIKPNEDFNCEFEMIFI